MSLSVVTNLIYDMIIVEFVQIIEFDYNLYDYPQSYQYG